MSAYTRKLKLGGAWSAGVHRKLSVTEQDWYLETLSRIGTWKDWAGVIAGKCTAARKTKSANHPYQTEQSGTTSIVYLALQCWYYPKHNNPSWIRITLVVNLYRSYRWAYSHQWSLSCHSLQLQIYTLFVTATLTQGKNTDVRTRHMNAHGFCGIVRWPLQDTSLVIG